MLLLNGIDLQSYPYDFYIYGGFELSKSLMKSDMYSHGTYLSRSKIEERSFTIRGFINSDNKETEFQEIENAEDILKKELFKDGLKQFSFIRGGRIVSIFAEVENISNSYDDSIAYEINLIACDPYLYGEEIELNINLYRSGITFPLKFPFKFGESSNVTNIINNEGTEMTYPVIEIKGPCISPSISNVTTKEGLTFNGLELFANDTLVIDNRPRTRSIKINGTNRIDLKNGSWISCKSGLNEFSFSAISSTDESLCKIRLQSRWI